MRVSAGNERARPSAATRASCARERPEKNRACPRTLAASAGFSLLSDNLLELRELVFLHEDGVLLARIAARAHVIPVIREAFLDDRHQIDVDLRVPRRMRLVEME